MNMYSWQVIFTMTWLKMEAWEIPIYWGPAAEEWLVKDAKSRGNRGRKNMERQYYIRNTGTTRLWQCHCRQSIHYLWAFADFLCEMEIMLLWTLLLCIHQDAFIKHLICCVAHSKCSVNGGGFIAKSRPTLLTPWTVCSLPGSSVHGILQARVLEWVAISFFIVWHIVSTQ